MPKFREIGNIWNNIKEVDLRPLREAALRPLKIALVGSPGSGRHTLAAQMRIDPSRPQMQTQTPIVITDLENPGRADTADLIIMVVDPTQGRSDREQEVGLRWVEKGKPVLLFINKIDTFEPGQSLDEWVNWEIDSVVFGSATNPASLLTHLVPAVMQLLPERHLSLGRQFPLFRLPIARQLIDETCFTNAAYSLSTGLAEIVPALGLPLNVADMFVLTKAQAFLVYRLGLIFGFSTSWQDYVAEFGSVVGGGFMWRQLARHLVGLVPVWGIVPKVAVAYAGTYVVGQTILQWYLTGRHIDPKQMRAMYRQAFERGKGFARELISKAPRPRLPRPRLGFRKKMPELPAPVAPQACPACGRVSASDALFCQYCGQPLPPENSLLLGENLDQAASGPGDAPLPPEAESGDNTAGLAGEV